MNATQLAKVKAILFDFDGTLIDSMPLHFEAYRQTFAEAGLSLTREQFDASIGGNSRETIPKLVAGRPCTWSVAELHARKKEVVNELFANGPIVELETAKLLPLFAARMPVALASSGSRVGIEILLRRLGWNNYFQAIICGEDTPHGKPAPDLFLLAAERLQVPPADCLVFEDTDAGVAAAAAAGMASFDVRRTLLASSI